MEISAINCLPTLDVYSLHRILASDKITDNQKIQFIRNNYVEIHNLVKTELTNDDFLDLMQGRPLIKFRPLKNSYTKWGDKIILGKLLGIPPSQVANYIKNVTAAMTDINQMTKNLPMDKIDSLKTYVFRHGLQNQVVVFLDYELKNSKNITKTLKQTMSYGNGGMADYFTRPIHRMKNKTMVKLYNVIDKNLSAAQLNGKITPEEKEKLSLWILPRLYSIRENSKFIQKKPAEAGKGEY